MLVKTNRQAAAIADSVVPRYKQKPYPPCYGYIAKQWGAAYEAALLTLEQDVAVQAVEPTTGGD